MFFSETVRDAVRVLVSHLQFSQFAPLALRELEAGDRALEVGRIKLRWAGGTVTAVLIRFSLSVLRISTAERGEQGGRQRDRHTFKIILIS